MGITAGKQRVWGVMLDDSGRELSQFSRDYKTVAIDVLCNYANKEWVRVYTYLEPGVSFKKITNTYPRSSTEHSNETIFNMYYMPIGISVGKRVSGFAELGFGFKGIVNAGLSFRFPKSESYRR